MIAAITREATDGIPFGEPLGSAMMEVEMRATTGKERFENNLVDLIRSECRRRKTQNWIVLWHVVHVVNRMRDDQRYEFGLQERK